MENYYHKNYENASNFVIHDHHLIKDSRVIALDKLTSTEICSILISKVQNKPSTNIYFENLSNDYNTDLAANYMLPCLIKYNKLHTLGIKLSPKLFICCIFY